MGEKEKRRSVRWLFFLYCGLMLWLLFGQRIALLGPGNLAEQFENHLNLTPFKTILWFLRLRRITDDPYLLTHAYVNLAGNVLLFVPLGFLLPQAIPAVNRLWKLLYWVTAAMILVEVAQLVTRLGSCDVDDLILNLAGAVIGYSIWRIKTK